MKKFTRNEYAGVSRPVTASVLLAFFLFMGTVRLSATDWYLDGSEGDMSSLASLAGKVKAGDRIFLKRGSHFRGGFSLVLEGTREKPVSISAYGEGPLPVISDFFPVSGWEPAGKGLWRTTLPSVTRPSAVRTEGSSAVLQMLVRDGVPLQIARFPNADAAWGGYLAVEGHRGTASISARMPGGVDWRGAEVVVRSRRWILDRVTVRRIRRDVISFESPLSYEPYDGWGFFFQNHPSALDQEGEWCYEAAKGLLWLRTEGDPRMQHIEYPICTVVADFSGSTHLFVENIEFRGGNHLGLRLDQTRHVHLSGCVFTLGGTNALEAIDARYLSIRDCRFTDIQNNAVLIERVETVRFTGNLVERTALRAGMGRGGDGQYNALTINGRDIHIEGNLIIDTGYLPVNVRGDDILIADNIIERYAIVKDDAGGIYTWSDGKKKDSNRIIRGNIVRDGIGAPEGQTWTGSATNGIYIDDRSNAVDILDNVIVNAGEYGIYIHNARDILIQGNLVADCDYQLALIKDGIAPEYPVTGIRVRGNRFVSLNAGQGLVKLVNYWNSEEPGVVFSGNHWAAPFRGVPLFMTDLRDHPVSVHDPASWTLPGGRDPSGHLLSLTRDAVRVLSVGETNLAVKADTTEGLAGWQYWASRDNGRVEGIGPGEVPVTESSGSAAGPAVRISFTRTSGAADSTILFYSPLFPVTEGSWLSLDFFARSGRRTEGIVDISFLMRRGREPWTQVTAEYPFALDREWRSYRILFPVNRDEKAVRAEFRLAETGLFPGEFVEIADMDVRVLDVEIVDPGRYLRVIVNTERNARAFVPEDGWQPLFRELSASGNISLDPYDGCVLWRE